MLKTSVTVYADYLRCILPPMLLSRRPFNQPATTIHAFSLLTLALSIPLRLLTYEFPVSATIMQERSAPQENGKSPAAASRSGKRSPGSNANTSVQSTRRPLTSSEGFPPPAVANQAGIPLTTTPKRHPKPNPAKTPETSVMKILMPATKSPLNITSLNVGGKLVEFNLSPVKGEYPEFAKIPAAMKSNGFK